MPLTYNRASLKKIQSQIAGIVEKGSPQRKAILGAAAAAVKALTREQLRLGTDPDGAAQKLTKHGKPGLQSEKLARGAVAVVVDGDRIRGFSKNSKWSPILEAHQEGHTFPPRSGVQRRNARGRLIGKAKFNRLVEGAIPEAWQHTSGSYGYAKATTGRLRASIQRTKGGERILPQRPIYPTGSTLTPRWVQGIGIRVVAALGKALGGDK